MSVTAIQNPAVEIANRESLGGYLNFADFENHVDVLSHFLAPSEPARLCDKKKKRNHQDISGYLDQNGSRHEQ